MTVLLYYKYVFVADPATEVQAQKTLCEKLGIKGRIFIGEEGINGTCCGTQEGIREYEEAMSAHPIFHDIAFKKSHAGEHVFEKLIVRLRPEVVTLRTPVNLKHTGKRVSPEQLHQQLEQGQDMVLVDMRNDYEAKIGKFKDAVTLPMQNFRDLPDMLKYLEPYRKRKIVTYCTGGIRCEKASAYLVEQGFHDVHQLEGGIVTYAEKFPDGYFEGTCFVFDKRMAVRFCGQKPPKILAECAFCTTPCDRYIDCTDIPCHTLFLCCASCERTHAGLCQAHEQPCLVSA